jgi:RNA polymerase sigma-70 factor (ECF subfamily)
MYDPSGTEKWLAAIFRNVYLRHVQRNGRDHVRPDPVTADEPSDAFDIEVELERRELAELLDRALALLPAQTRDVLVHRFVRELPVGKVAERVGLSAGAVQMRLQRGKLAMRRTLVTQYGDDARAYGLIGDDEVGWQQTRIWCPWCGSAQMRGRRTGPQRRLELVCTPCDTSFIDSDTARFGVTGFRAAMRKSATASHEFWRDGIRGLGLHQHRLALQRHKNHMGADHMDALCGPCDFNLSSSLDAQALFTDEGMEFWRQNPRIRRVAYEPIEAAGVAAVRVAFESVTSAARLDAIVAQRDFRIIRIVRR